MVPKPEFELIKEPFTELGIPDIDVEEGNSIMDWFLHNAKVTFQNG